MDAGVGVRAKEMCVTLNQRSTNPTSCWPGISKQEARGRQAGGKWEASRTACSGVQNKALRFMEDKRETKGKQIEDTWETKGGPRQQQAEDRWKRSRIQGTKKLMDDKGDNGEQA